MTKFREIVNAEYAKVKQLSAERKHAKALIATAYADYKKFMTEIYKPGRKAAFAAIDKAKADRKTAIAAKKAAKPEVKKSEAKATVKASVKTAVKKAAVKKAVKKAAVKKAAAAK